MSTSDPQRPAREGTGEPGTDTGRHAVARPAPTPPEPAVPPVDGGHDATGPAPAPPGPPTTAATHPSTSAAPPLRARDPRPEPAPAGRGPAAADPAAAGAARAAVPDEPTAPDHGARRTDGDDEDLFPDPNAPRTAHAGTHVLGVLVGLVLAPVAALLALVGQSRVLAVQTDEWDASLDVLGIVLASVGVVLLAVVLLLSLWTPAVSLTGGGVLGLLGGLALYAPGIARQQVLALVDADSWYRTTVETVVAATSGTLLLAGVLLLVAGLVAAVARRRGVHLGAFRERNRAA